jgi:hypothetical protein
MYVTNFANTISVINLCWCDMKFFTSFIS